MKLGEYQELIYVKKKDFGIYLGETPNAQEKERVLLPIKQVPADLQPFDTIRVFLYKDSSDRLIATTNEPTLTIGQLAVLKVKEIGKIGAFLDWGLEKDLFLPFKEMTQKVSKDDEVLFTLYIDKSERLCASMKGIYNLLSKESPYKKDDVVTGRVYEFSDNFGTFVAVDDKYSARIDHRTISGSGCPYCARKLPIIGENAVYYIINSFIYHHAAYPVNVDDNGKLYYAKIYLKDGKLILRGSLDRAGILGRSRTWIRK